MPIAPPTMPFSESGVSATRSEPNSAWRPSVTRNTPPFRPTSSPSTITVGSSRSATRKASWRAWTMVIWGMEGSSMMGDRRVANASGAGKRTDGGGGRRRLPAAPASPAVRGAPISFD